MEPRDFQCPDAGRVIQTRAGYAAFIPAPLPPKIEYSPDLVLALSRADAALSELAGLGRHLSDAHLLVAPYIRHEAVLSSSIEGTQTTLPQLLRAEVDDMAADADVFEVRNYVRALEHGIERLRDFPLSLRLVRELHEHLMTGIRDDQATPGEFRRSQNWLGPAGSTPISASYVPPPPQQMLKALDRWERFLHEHDKLPDLIQCALMHEHIEAIHPFLDGNGRVGRILITLFLIERGRLPQPLLCLSAFIEAHSNEYYDLLMRIRTDCDWPAWLHFFLTGVRETAQAAVRQARTLMALRESYRIQLQARPWALALLDTLFVNPYIAVARAAEALDVSVSTARRAIAILLQKDIVQEIGDSPRSRLYLARPILEAIEGNTLLRR